MLPQLNIRYLRLFAGVKNKFSIIQIILYATALNIILGLVMGAFTTTNNPVFKEHYSLIKLLFIAVLAGPLVETLIFQGFVISTVNKLTKNALISAIISALLFGLCHNYGTVYQLKTFISGLLYASLYIMYRSKNKSILIVLGCHGLYNASILGFDYLLA